MKRYILLIIVSAILNLCVFASVLMAQNPEGQHIEMADTFRSDGKIYVVVLVVAIVFTGLILFAVNTDRKLSKIEREIESLKSPKDS